MTCCRTLVFALITLLALVSPALHADPNSQFPEKPAGLDDVGWAALKQALAKSIGQQAKLTGDGSLAGADGEANDQFGFSVALSGDTALVGARLDTVGANENQGSAYVYIRSGSTWTLQAKLTAGDGRTNDQFGWSVALAGSTALVGAVLDDIGASTDQGSAYVFARSGSTWTQQAKLTAGDGATQDAFGWSVALSGSTALVGAYLDDVGADTDHGSAYVFTGSGSTWTQQAKLTAGDGATEDRFGISVALSGNTALAGAPYDDVGANNDQGSAYVYTRSGSDWTQQAKLMAGDGAASDAFGSSVALSVSTALVGAVGDNNQGSAYVYTRSGSDWTQQAKLTAGDGAAADEFGISAALSGDTAVIGAWLDDIGASDRGSAYVYTRNGSTWTQQAKLTAGDGATGDRLGLSVALSGSTALVGAHFDDIGANENQGSAYVYSRSDSDWTQQAQLTAGDGAADDRFGISVALSGDTALVGAWLDDIGANENQGSAYVYIRSGSTWTQQAQLTASDGAANDQFGISVALSGNTALVGAPFDDIVADDNQGSAYVYTRSGSTWTLQAKLTAGDGQANDEFGFSVALSGGTALIGAPNDEIGTNENQGSAYVYTGSGSTWTQQAKLTAGDGAANDEFGNAVALSGDTALVGAHLDDIGTNGDQGSAYIYARSGSTWTQQAKLTAGGTFAQFGNSVALSGDTALIGAWHASVGANLLQGSAYVFTRSGSTWTLQAVLSASDGDTADGFGSSVALSGGTALVGASSDEVVANFGQGSAYVYSRSGSAWTQQAKLTANDGAANEGFGDSIALSGNTALIGSPFKDGPSPFGNPNEGAAYVFIGLNLDNTTSTITADLPDPSTVGQSAAISVVVAGTTTAPSAGTVTVNASTGESCSDDTPRVGGGTSSLYSCEMIFNTPGSRMLIASYSGSAAHAGSISLAEPHQVREASSTVISAATPDPSQAGGTVPVSVSVSGASTAPADGQVTVQASTGESCNDTSPSAGTGGTVLFGCDLVFANVGPRTLTATFSGSTTHAISVSAVEPHMVVTTLIVAPASLPGGMFGAAYDQTLSASGTGSSASYSFGVSNGALPSGLNLDVGSGRISGTAAAAGSFTFTITATDSSLPAVGGPFTGSRAYTVQIARANQATLTLSATPPTILFNGTSALGTSGGSGTGAISFAVTSGASFCSISGSTLTGIGVGTCTVTATKGADANFNAATANVNITVQAGPIVIAGPDWTQRLGNWALAAAGPVGNFQSTASGTALYESISFEPGTGGDFAYTVELRATRPNQPTAANTIFVAGTPTPLQGASQWWNTGIAFNFASNGKYSIFRYDGASKPAALQAWTTPAGTTVNGSGQANRLRVEYAGGTLAFYLNNVLVRTLPGFVPQGRQVGVAMVRSIPAVPGAPGADTLEVLSAEYDGTLLRTGAVPQVDRAQALANEAANRQQPDPDPRFAAPSEAARATPVVERVTVPADGRYLVGQALEFVVHFSMPVVVEGSGAPRIAVLLDAGGSAFAQYAGGSGSTALAFRYTVAPSHRDPTGLALGSAIDLAGSTLCDPENGNPAVLYLAAVAPTAGVLVGAPEGLVPVAIPAASRWTLLLLALGMAALTLRAGMRPR